MIPYASREALEHALCLAAKGGYFSLVSALLDHQVSPDSVQPIQQKSSSIVTGGDTALILAAVSFEPRCVEILLERGANVHKASSRNLDRHYLCVPGNDKIPRLDSKTPLHALARRHITKDNESSAKAILSMLVSAGADLEARDGNGATPIMDILVNGHQSADPLLALDLFQSAGADLCASDDNGETLVSKLS